MRTVRVGAKSGSNVSSTAAPSSTDSTSPITNDAWLSSVSTLTRGEEDLPPIVVLESADHVCYPLPRSLAFRMLSVRTRMANGEHTVEEFDDGLGGEENNTTAEATTDGETATAADTTVATTSSTASSPPSISLPSARLFFPDINSTAMRKVIEFCTYEWREEDVLALTSANAPRPGPGAFKAENQAIQAKKEAEAEEKFRQAAIAEAQDPSIIQRLSSLDGPTVTLLPRPAESMYAFLRNASSTILCELASASFYLDVKPLVEATCRSIAGLIRGKSAEEIRSTFSITNDFTPAEEEAVGRSIVERAMLLPADVIDSDDGAHALLSAPIPRAQPLITAPVRESKRTKLQKKLASRMQNEPAQPSKPADVSVDELMDFIDGNKKKKKKTSTTAKPAAAPSAPSAAALAAACIPLGPSVPAAVAMLMDNNPNNGAAATGEDDESAAGGVASSSAAKRKKKKNKKKATTAGGGNAEVNDDSAPVSPTLTGFSSGSAASSIDAFRNYSSSALSALMNDPQALAGLLANHMEAELSPAILAAGADIDMPPFDTAAAAASFGLSAQDQLDLVNGGFGTGPGSFSSSLGALVQSLHSFDSLERSALERAARARGVIQGGAEVMEEDEPEEQASSSTSAASSTNRSKSGSNADQQQQRRSDSRESDRHQQNEVEKFQALLSEASASGSTQFSPAILSAISRSHFTRKASDPASRSVDDSPFFLPDAQLSKLIDAKLSGLANWESKRSKGDGGESVDVDEGSVDFNLRSDALESFAPYMCTCSAAQTAKADANAAAAASQPNAIASTSSGAAPAPSISSASCPSSPSSSPQAAPAPPAGGLSHMTLCAHCGLFQVKNAASDDSRLNLASPTKRTGGGNSQINSPTRTGKSSTRKAVSERSESPPSITQPIPAATLVPPPSAASALKPRAATSSPPAATSSCQNHGSGSCSCCATLASILPRLTDLSSRVAELSSLQQRLASVENQQKQAAKGLAQKLAQIEKSESAIKTLQSSVTKLVSEEKQSRTKVEESLRRDFDQFRRSQSDALDELRSLVETSATTVSQSQSNATNETKQRLQRVSDRLAAIEKSAVTAKEESEKEQKRVNGRIEKLIAQTVAKELATHKSTAVASTVQSQSTSSIIDDRREYMAMGAKLEQALRTLDQQRAQQEAITAQAVDHAVQHALAKYAQTQSQQQLHHPSQQGPLPHDTRAPPSSQFGNGQIPPHYSASSLLTRQSHTSPSQQPTGLHSVFSSGGSSLQPTHSSLSSNWQRSEQSNQPLSSQLHDREADLYPSYDNAVLPSSLLTDDTITSSGQPSYFSMFAPPTVGNNAKQPAPVGSAPFANRTIGGGFQQSRLSMLHDQ